jgi:hypothetical protein
MKLKQILYHLERASAAHADDEAGLPVSRGALRYGTHLERAAMHEEKAAAYLAEGLREYASRAQTQGAREQRRRRARLGADPRTPADRVGRGRGRWGQRWGKSAPK